MSFGKISLLAHPVAILCSNRGFAIVKSHVFARNETDIVNPYSPVYKPQQLTLSVGSPYIEEVVLDLKFHLVPSMHFWNNIHAAKMVCRGIAELLAPTKKISVLEVGCGFGLIGLYLSKVRMGCGLIPVSFAVCNGVYERFHC